MELQQACIAIQVGSWARHEDFAVHPRGAKPKRMLICPEDATEPYLIPTHAYLFKKAEGWRAQQVWSEVVASRIAMLVGLEVPLCFIAMDGDGGTVGSLHEFFYGYPNECEPARLVHGSDIIRRVRVRQRTDRPHGVRTNVTICRKLGLPDVVDWWGRVIMFDALIGNTDRHPDNWGYLVRRHQGSPSQSLAFSPVFDNGTSLGYEQAEAKLSAACEEAWLMRYIEKGTHHCGWDPADDARAPHIDLCARYLDAYPEAGAAMKGVLQFDATRIAEIVNDCAAVEVSMPFSAQRATFVSALVDARRERLSAVVGI